MKKLEIDTIPVWRVGTDEIWLEKYLKETDYIAIGAIANLNTQERIRTLSRVFRLYLTSFSGAATHKVHGLGLTALELVRKFPWYSVDSFTPVISAAMGGILAPELIRRGSEQYESFSIIKVSNKAKHTPGMKNSYLNLPRVFQKKLADEMEAVGFKLGDPYSDREAQGTITGSWTERMRWNLIIWDRVMKQLPSNRFEVAGDAFEVPPTVFVGVSSEAHLEEVMKVDSSFNLLISFAYYKNDKAFSGNSTVQRA